jgi:hypothetical protein
MVRAMQRYGVKLKSGKVLWVEADDVEVRDGVVLFLARTERGKETLAGFSLGVIDHFGRPEAFPAAELASKPS